ncbi:hypothetical protein J1605_003906 [Eschrichtius robustus]|uniref:Uncharacterized protein n=1 Tax=Eschrichtius robustus TaxID=9764 RepID=A0AB34HL65_ESCRO|nr:hypothetical protein J1605_003906 [Eschrichtius robustus]
MRALGNEGAQRRRLTQPGGNQQGFLEEGMLQQRSEQQPCCQPVSSLCSSPAPWGSCPLRADQVSELRAGSCWCELVAQLGAGSSSPDEGTSPSPSLRIPSCPGNLRTPLLGVSYTLPWV